MQQPDPSGSNGLKRSLYALPALVHGLSWLALAMSGISVVRSSPPPSAPFPSSFGAQRRLDLFRPEFVKCIVRDPTSGAGVEGFDALSFFDRSLVE